MNKNFYDILGIDKSASEKEIKKAYRKLSLQYHPDKQNGKSEEEQKEAELKMQEINEAYAVLSDSEKKANYDRYGDPNGMQGWDPFGGMRQKYEPVYQGETCVAHAYVSIKDLYDLKDVNIKYKKNIRCEHCHGKGNDSIVTCPHCHGTGMITEVYQQGNTRFMNQTTCPHCHGTGEIRNGNDCEYCNGYGVTETDAEVKLKLNTSWFNDDGNIHRNIKVRLNGAGSEAPQERSVPGDLIVVVHSSWDKDRYAVKDNKIYENIDVDLWDALTGTSQEVELPDGKKLKIKIPQLSYNGKLLKLKNKGMKQLDGSRTDYMLKVDLLYPEKLTEKQVELLKQIKEDE